jgi:hypothetical protein
MSSGTVCAMSDVPQRLLDRLDALGAVFRERGDVIALLGLGSVGTDLGRLDEHSDLDFFVVTDDGANAWYKRNLDWLEVAPIAYAFENSIHGCKILWEDGLYAEYAVFTLDELKAGSYTGARVVFARDDAPADIEQLGAPIPPSPYLTPEYQVGEMITNLYIGLHRELRGERLAAMRLIQVHAVDRLMTYLDLTGQSTRERQDPFAVERGAERRLEAPFAELVPGYERNREAALAMLAWLEERVEVDPTLARKIRELAAT